MPYRDQHCSVIEKDSLPIDVMKAEQMAAELAGWSVVDGGKGLCRNYHFKDFKTSLELVQCISVIAEQENHHPDISFGWGYATITLTTHACAGLSMNDFIMAAKINSCS